MAEEEDWAYGGAPWSDQVSVTQSTKNSSSSSLVKQPEQDRPTTPPSTASDHEPDENTETSTSTIKVTPRSSRVRSSFRSRNALKSQSAETQVESSTENPLADPLTSNETSHENPGKNSNQNLVNGVIRDEIHSAGSFHEIPLNVSSPVNNSASDDMVSASLGRLNVDDKEAISPATGASNNNGNSVTFKITVGDPIKVGDITSAHTVYTVHTSTNSPSFSKQDVSVTRRYRDFRWLFHALENNNHGIIIPPPPEKQAVGRFNEEFVEQRRTALENMLNKIARHPQLHGDPDLRLFLESEAFSNDIKNRVVTPEELEQANSTGFMSSLGGAFSFSSKFIETNQWFTDKKLYIDALETQLKSLSKALDAVVSQRRELSDSVGEFGLILESLSDLEISKNLSELLESFAQAHSRIKELYSRQCLQEIMSLSATFDEYLRIISSIRSVFSQRQKAFFNVQQADQELSKKRSGLEKLLRQGKTLQDRIAVTEQEVEAGEQKVVNCRVIFDDISKIIQKEFDRVEHEKIADFRNSVELFLENAVESQKAAIEIWETFYQRNFMQQTEIEA